LEIQAQVDAALAALEKMSTKHDRDNLKRFGITAGTAYGVSMANIQALAKRLGRSTTSRPRSGRPAGTRRGSSLRSSTNRRA
jgi:hypothetical protein